MHLFLIEEVIFFFRMMMETFLEPNIWKMFITLPILLVLFDNLTINFVNAVVEPTQGKIWPHPQTIRPGKGIFLIDPRNFNFKVCDSHPFSIALRSA